MSTLKSQVRIKEKTNPFCQITTLDPTTKPQMMPNNMTRNLVIPFGLMQILLQDAEEGSR